MMRSLKYALPLCPFYSKFLETPCKTLRGCTTVVIIHTDSTVNHRTAGCHQSPLLCFPFVLAEPSLYNPVESEADLVLGCKISMLNEVLFSLQMNYNQEKLLISNDY